MKILKVLLFLLSLLIIIPLGIMSKVMYRLSQWINNLILNFKAYFEGSYTKYWKEAFNVESKLATWEIRYGFLEEKDGIIEINTDETAPIAFMYFKEDSGDPDITINITEKEFEDLLEFAKKLNKQVIKGQTKNGNTE